MKNRNLPHVRNAIYGQPWAITPDGLDQISVIYERSVLGDGKELAAAYGRDSEGDLPRYQVINGVAILPLVGPLFPRANLFTAISRATSYEEFSGWFNEAMERSDVGSIVIHCDSPGGSALGLMELAREIHEATKVSEKEIIGLADGLCCSAAYAICSQCHMMAATEGSLVGSIGVIAKYDNYDRQERNEGNDSIVLRSSELKAPGSGPITPNQQQSLQKIVMAYFEQFKSAVIRGRKEIDIEKVSSGEVWIGSASEDLKLVDEICTLDDLVERYGVTAF